MIMPLALALASWSSAAGLCPMWGDAVQAGALDSNQVPEASGLAVSRRWPSLYHINDSGDGPFFYASDMDGGGMRKVRYDGHRPVDTEDLSLGPCGKGTCLYIGDIGDNKAVRTEVALVLVPEEEPLKDSVKTLKVLRLRYPDGAHNAEGMAVHPNGDVFIVTKETPRKKKTRPARVFRLPAAAVRAAKDEPLTLEPWGELDVPAINKDADKFGRIVSSFDIAPDGKRFLLLTYANAIEFAVDIAAGPLARPLAHGQDYRRVPLKRLVQQESIAYLPDGNGFLYDTEYAPKTDRGQKEPELFRVACLGSKL